MTNNSVNFYILISLINTFHKNITLNDLEYCDDVDDFMKYNSEYIFETIDYINYYLEEYNKLNELELKECNFISNDLYSEELIELILASKKRDNEVLNNILYTQKCILEKILTDAKRNLQLFLHKDDNLDELLFEFNNMLRYDYKLRKKYVKMKLLVK